MVLPDETPRLIDLQEVSRLTSLRRSAIYERIAQGEFKVIKLGRRSAFIEAEVHAWIREQVAKAHA